MFAVPDQRGDEYKMKGGIDSDIEEFYRKGIVVSPDIWWLYSERQDTLVGTLVTFSVNILLVLDGIYGGDDSDDEELSGLTLGKHSLDVVEGVKLNPEQILELYKASMNEFKTNPTYRSRSIVLHQTLSLDPLKLSSTPSSTPLGVINTAWRYLKVARALSSTQTHYYDMQIDEILRSHSTFIESGSINDITMDIEEMEFYKHPFAGLLMHISPQFQKDTKKKVQSACL
ncbi:hypothetical protein HK098_008303 [Nowakowskiella sp. JEL0407]|nr:hypothetical protein HK098_008303 [Nowakowskiella sp. JEL0407]